MVSPLRLPGEFLDSLKGVQGFDKEAFEKIHTSGEQVTSIRVNPFKVQDPETLSFADVLGEAVPWTEFGYYLNARPSFTFDPLFHAGCYYVQEASSMFLEQALKQTTDLSQPIKVLDLCGAPGGKSTHIQSLISRDSLLVSNEIIRQRTNVLKDNIIKWGCRNVMVTANDPIDFMRLENYFDVIIVDAPCSGSGLFRRDGEAIKEWSLNNVSLCSQRQQRILADALPALKKEGILIYSTCSYSQEEDEQVADWLIKEFSMEGVKLSIENNWQIVETRSEHGAYGYRFFPDKVKGEGLFVSCLRKTTGSSESIMKNKDKLNQVSSSEKGIVEKWSEKDDVLFIKHLNRVYAWPGRLVADFNFLSGNLRLVYSGTIIGELVRDKLIPDHALAMSNLVRKDIRRTVLNKEQAIAYLQKKELKMENPVMGWQLANYKGHDLGWLNGLTNRINNYYPKELRILKDS